MVSLSSVVDRTHRALLSGAAFAILAGAASAQSPAQAVYKANSGPILALSATPGKITLSGLYDTARVLITGRTGDGGARDVSGEAVLTVADPKIAVVEDGTIRARKDGMTTLTARLKGKAIRVPLVVRGVAKAGPPRFVADVMPVLTKAGCNMGACHGAAQGKGGFKLSLLGYDPDSDYEAITRAASARRIARSQPDNSLLLRKPTMRVAHRGGKRLDVGSPEYRILRDWIAGGVPGPEPTEPRVAKLEVVPLTKTLGMGQRQRFIVRARYSDNTIRDVTEETLFTASDETVATVTPSGEAKAVGNGDGAVLIRYRDLVATAHVLSPYSKPRGQGLGARGQGLGNPTPYTLHPTPSDGIDRLVNQKLGALGLEPSGLCSDADFLRRAYLDVIGVLPTPDEARKFLADRDAKKREKLVDALLERPEYVDFWTLKWGDLLRSNRNLLSDKGMYALHFWIRRSVAENKPWDQFARELLLSRGSAYENGAVNFYRTSNTPQERAETTSQVFLGVRIQCARCHNHPYEKWTQNQYYQMAAFFARMTSKKGERPNEPVFVLANGGEVKNPKTQQEAAPCALDATPIPADFNGDRREALAQWITSPQNPFFSRVIVNRLWKHFLGRGLIEPVDDVRVTNPASNEELLSWMAGDLSKHGYDLKYLIRAIMRSQTYQRAAEPTKANARDAKYYSHYLFKRLSAEQLLDAITSATQVAEKFDGYPAGMRAAQLPDTNVSSYFLELFGRPARSLTCACERVDDPNLGQVIHLMNNAGLNGRISAKDGRVAKLIGAKLPDRQIVEDLYYATFSRCPTSEESRKATQALATAKDKQRAAEDVLWALMNSKEFIFNH